MRPYLASGGVMAIEDGAALAVSLTNRKVTSLKVLSCSGKAGQAPSRQVVQASTRMGRVYHCPPPFDMIRDLAIRLSSGSRFERRDWLYGAGTVNARPEKLSLALRKAAPLDKRELENRGFSMEPYAGTEASGAVLSVEWEPSGAEARTPASVAGPGQVTG